MSAGTRIAGFVLALGVVFGAGAALGQAVGPIDIGGSGDHHPTSTEPTTPSAAHPDGHTP